jgi:dipeptidyl aminopeptidase/acylaminoacyl peptidase
MRRALEWALLSIIAAAAVAHTPGHAAEPILARRAVFAPPDVLNVTVSPDGRHLAYLAVENGRTNLWLAPIDHPQQAKALIREPDRSVFTYEWSLGGRGLIYQTGRHLTFWTDNAGADDYVVYALDLADGSSRALTPKLDRRIDLFVSQRKPRDLFVSPSPRSERPEASVIDVSTGRTRAFDFASGLAPVHPDRDLVPRLATRSADLSGIEVLLRPGRQAWRSQWKLNFAERLIFKVHGFDARGTTVFVTQPNGYDSGALTAVELASGKASLIAYRAGETITDVLLHPRSGQPIAYKSGRLRASWMVLDSRYEEDFKRLGAQAAALAQPESDLSIVSRDAQDRLWLVAYEADVMPRRYYLYDRRTHELRALFAEAKVREGLQYSTMYPVMIRARDGLELPSYLTVPRSTVIRESRPEQPLPMVLWVHGGPQSRESWRFDPQAQWLASRGYAVLSVNFRGSSGFGKRFIEAGYGEWGRKMQEDLIDSVHWAVRKGVADPKRIAIMGLSHGGYATLRALAGAPELFACGVETVGLSDLSLFLDTLAAYGKKLTDPDAKSEFEGRLARDRMQLGGDERTDAGRAALAAQSPINQADAIRVPVLITHGLLDDGVVPAHSERMVAALEQHRVPVVYLAYPDEGHGLALTANKISQAAVTEAFLARCIGGSAAPFEPADFEHSSIDVRAGAALVPRLSEALATRTATGAAHSETR